jgi:hypothetical protein
MELVCIRIGELWREVEKHEQAGSVLPTGR